MTAERGSYTRGTSVVDAFDEAVDRTVEALAEEGLGVMWAVDARATFEAKLGESFRPSLILGACAPSLAYEALGHESRLGALLPCNVVVQETDDGVEVSLVDPETLLASSTTRISTPSSRKSACASIASSAHSEPGEGRRSAPVAAVAGGGRAEG